VEVKDSKESLEVVVTGDTVIDALDENPFCYEAKILIMECTYIEDKLADLARERGHIHLQDIISRAEKFKNEKIILMVTVSSRPCLALSALVLNSSLLPSW